MENALGGSDGLREYFREMKEAFTKGSVSWRMCWWLAAG